MGPYVALNAVLVGAFGFAAIYHFLLWSQSRHVFTERALRAELQALSSRT